MNNTLFKVGESIYIKPNAREILLELDKLNQKQFGSELGWSSNMGEMVGRFYTISNIQKPNHDRPYFRVVLGRWRFYPECLDYNVKTVDL